MIDDLYSARLLTLAANMPRTGRLARPQATVEKVARPCGSRAVIDVRVENGLVVDYAHDVKACALGQAAAAVVAANIVGASVDAIESARDAFRAMLKAGGPPVVGRFAELGVLEPVRAFPERHNSTLLVLEAAAEAARAANCADARTPTADAA